MTPAVPDRIAIVAAERASSGARLVAVDERGDRQLDLVVPPPGGAIVRDTNPAISPDGRWLIFASSRGRSLDETSLWIAPLTPDATATPLTHGAWIDSHPTWLADGSAIVFASTRRAGNFDLYRLALDHGRAVGEPEPLTSAPGHEVTPCVAPGGAIVYASVTPIANGEVESHLEQRALDGTITHVTEGPADSSPAISPDGKQLAFTRPSEHGDAELWLAPLGGDVATIVVDLPLTDEGGAVWSRDGRFLFATSILRNAAHAAIFSSVIVIDLREPHRRARILEDRTGAIARLTPAITRTPLDAAALDADPEYVPELARIVAAAIADQERR